MKDTWHYDDATHRYFMDGKRVPGVSTLTDGLDDTFARIDPEILERKRLIGTAVHYACELIDSDELDEDSVHQSIVGYLDAYRKFLQQMRPKWLLSETWRCHDRWRYGGRLDRFGTIGGDHMIIDLKTVAQLHPKAGPQTAGYKELVLQDDPTLLIGRAALQLKPNGTYVYESYRDNDDWLVFCSLLQTFHWKLKRGLIKQ